jgi:hypothetical protein
MGIAGPRLALRFLFDTALVARSSRLGRREAFRLAKPFFLAEATTDVIAPVLQQSTRSANSIQELGREDQKRISKKRREEIDKFVWRKLGWQF